tara:strand:- start:1016 stop:1789 length:774 start_codon:yes stop_codon:yes gene_type:complete
MNILLIPSKERAEKNYLYNQIQENNVEYKIFVEPQDYNKYIEIHDQKNIVIIEQNNMGIAYVRNSILSWAVSNNIKRYWTLDDDIGSFYHREGTKMIKDNINVLEKAEKQFIENDFGIYALEYQQFAWSAGEREFSKNSYMDCCVCIDVEKAKKSNIKYRTKFALKEDRDFAMQFIKNGYETARSTLYAFSCPKNGSNKGGLYEVYSYNDREKETAAVKRLIEEWGDHCVKLIEKKDGRIDAKIFWKKINDKQERLF